MKYDIPILILAFNRYDHFYGLINIVKKIKPKTLYISIDGPRQNSKYDIISQEKILPLIKAIDWSDVIVNKFDKNYGCGAAVSKGISWFYSKVEHGIILEDDCHPSNFFFEFVKRYLFAADFISGSNYLINNKDDDIFFSNYLNIWGWWTSAKVWEKYVYDIYNYDDMFKLLNYKRYFNSFKEYLFYYYISNRIKNKYIDTWDYQLQLTAFRYKFKCLYSNQVMVKNVGQDNSGVRKFLNGRKQPIKVLNNSMSINDINRIIFKKQYDYSFDRLIEILRYNSLKDIINVLRTRNYL